MTSPHPCAEGPANQRGESLAVETLTTLPYQAEDAAEFLAYMQLYPDDAG